MYIKSKHVNPLGFVSKGLFESGPFLKEIKLKDDSHVFLLIGHLAYCTIEVFRPTSEQYKKYKKNKLSLVRQGCCSVSGREYITSDLLWQGEFKSQKHMRQLVESAEFLITN